MDISELKVSERTILYNLIAEVVNTVDELEQRVKVLEDDKAQAIV